MDPGTRTRPYASGHLNNYVTHPRVTQRIKMASGRKETSGLLD